MNIIHKNKKSYELLLLKGVVDLFVKVLIRDRRFIKVIQCKIIPKYDIIFRTSHTTSKVKIDKLVTISFWYVNNTNVYILPKFVIN